MAPAALRRRAVLRRLPMARRHLPAVGADRRVAARRLHRGHRADVRPRLPLDAVDRGPFPAPHAVGAGPARDAQNSPQPADLDSVRRLARPLLYVGTAVAVLAFAKEHAALVGHYSFHSSSRLPWTLAYIGLLCLAAYATGLPDLARNVRSAMSAAVLAVGSAAVGISLIQLAIGSLLLPRFVVASAAIVLVPWYVFCTLVAADGRSRDEDRDRVLAVVGMDEAAELESELDRAAERHASLVGTMTPAAARITSDAARRAVRPVLDAARRLGATVVVLDRAAAADDTIVEQIAALHESGEVRVRTLTLFYEEWLGKLPLSELERVALMFDIGELHRARYSRVKRMLDVVAGLAGLAVLTVTAPLVAVANRFGNRGPLFFRQDRVGRNGEAFSIVKLRSMRPVDPAADAVDTGAWTCEDDPRITPLGRWLRRSHLDELPQAWNLVRGDLSLCGPRPEQPRYVSQLTEKIPFYNLRHLVRPGLTGWAQVKYAYGSTEEDALEKLQYEFWYLRHQSLYLDARIVVRTLRSVVGRSGR